MDFSYLMPTKVIMGKDCIQNNANLFDSDWEKALIVTGKKSAKINGALNDVCQVLSASGLKWDLYDEVEPNPSIATVRKGAKLAKELRADFVIGIGGGSPLDAAKAIAFLAMNEADDEKMFETMFEKMPLPVIAVPTTAGTGSEVTQYSILTDLKTNTKKNLSNPALFPKIAFLDASYMTNLPYDTTVNTALDALSHAAESYLSKRATVMSSWIALNALSVSGQCLGSLTGTERLSSDTREKLLFASMLGGMAIAQTGTTVVHAMGYPLTCIDNIDHGRANGLLLCEFLKYSAPENPEKISKILTALGMVSVENLEVLFESLIGRYKHFSDEDLKKFTEMTVSAKSVANTLPEPAFDDIFGLYKRSLGR